jgi:hypothetical protein
VAIDGWRGSGLNKGFGFRTRSWSKSLRFYSIVDCIKSPGTRAGTLHLLFDEKRDGREEKPACQNRVEEQQKAGDEGAKSRFEVLLDRGRAQRQFSPKRPGFTT